MIYTMTRISVLIDSDQLLRNKRLGLIYPVFMPEANFNSYEGFIGLRKGWKSTEMHPV